jgi:regulator of replication initiation timing
MSCPNPTLDVNTVQNLSNKVNQTHQQLLDVQQGIMNTHAALKVANPKLASDLEKHATSLTSSISKNKEVQKHVSSLMGMFGKASKIAAIAKGGRRYKSRRHKRRSHKKTIRRRRR